MTSLNIYLADKHLNSVVVVIRMENLPVVHIAFMRKEKHYFYIIVPD